MAEADKLCPFQIRYEQVTIADEGCIPAIVALLSSSEDVPTQYYALMVLCRYARVPPSFLAVFSSHWEAGANLRWIAHQE